MQDASQGGTSQALLPEVVRQAFPTELSALLMGGDAGDLPVPPPPEPQRTAAKLKRRLVQTWCARHRQHLIQGAVSAALVAGPAEQIANKEPEHQRRRDQGRSRGSRTGSHRGVGCEGEAG